MRVLDTLDEVIFFYLWKLISSADYKVTKWISMNRWARRVNSQTSHTNLAHHSQQNWTIEINEHNFCLDILISVGILMSLFVSFSHYHIIQWKPVLFQLRVSSGWNFEFEIALWNCSGMIKKWGCQRSSILFQCLQTQRHVCIRCSSFNPQGLHSRYKQGLKRGEMSSSWWFLAFGI